MQGGIVFFQNIQRIMIFNVCFLKKWWFFKKMPTLGDRDGFENLHYALSTILQQKNEIPSGLLRKLPTQAAQNRWSLDS